MSIESEMSKPIRRILNEEVNLEDIDVDKKDTELHLRAKTGDKSLLGDPDVSKARNRAGKTPLHYLAEAGIVEVLNHPDVSTVIDNRGDTPLYILAKKGIKEALNHPDVAKRVKAKSVFSIQLENEIDRKLIKLNDLKADKKQRSIWKKLFEKKQKPETSLEMMEQEIKLLKEQKEKQQLVEVRHDYGKTPLHYLAFLGVKEVINHPSVATATDHYGKTPLHYLVEADVREALAHPEVSKVEDYSGKTPLDYLKESRDKDSDNKIIEQIGLSTCCSRPLNNSIVLSYLMCYKETKDEKILEGLKLSLDLIAKIKSVDIQTIDCKDCQNKDLCNELRDLILKEQGLIKEGENLENLSI
jgi:hypothetical protein